MTLETFYTLGELIGQQSDLLWQVAMAVVIAEIYIFCRFFESETTKLRGWWSLALLFGSILSHLLSLLFGYLTRGAIILVVSKADRTQELSKVLQMGFEDAEHDALLQFGFLMFGLILFIILFTLNTTIISKLIGRFKNG